MREIASESVGRLHQECSCRQRCRK